jgi:hypothetical protein
MSERFVPFSEVSNETDRLVIDPRIYPPTWLDGEVEMNINFAHHLLDLAGMERLHIAHGKSKKVNFEVTSAGGGVGTAGRVEVDRNENSFKRRIDHNVHNFAWIEPTIEFEPEQLLGRHGSSTGSSIEWAKKTDAIIRKNIRREGVRFLLLDYQNTELYALGVSMVYLIGAGILISKKEDLPLLAAIHAFTTLTPKLLSIPFEKYGAKYRFSLCLAWEIDRACALLIYSNKKGLVRFVGSP